MTDSKFNLNDTQLFKLSGLYDLLSKEELANIKPTKQEGSDYIRLQIECSELDLLVLFIYPTIKLIYVDVLLGSGKTKGIGKLWLKSIVRRASKRKYKLIELSAHRNDSCPAVYKGKEYKWNGYFVWGTLGFLMDQSEEITEFEKLVSDNKRKDDALHTLLSDDVGRKLWSKKGFRWHGRFLLNGQTTSKEILLNTYLY